MSKSKTSRAPSIRPPAVFPHPDPERCSRDAMAGAAALCAQRGRRLTPIRRKVLAALLASHKPLGAYEIIDRLALKGPPGADHHLPRARVPARERPRAPHRK